MRCVATTILFGALIPCGAFAVEPGAPSLDAVYGRLELSFEANWGQADAAAAFVARGAGYAVTLRPTEAVLSLSRGAAASDGSRRRSLAGGPARGTAGGRQTATVHMQLAGASANAEVLGAELLPGKVNYFAGRDPSAWRTNIPTYRKVRVKSVYPGVDLVYYGRQRELEYDFVVAPGADPRAIRIRYAGVDELRVDANGDLALRTSLGEIRQHRPLIYQDVGGEVKQIPGRHVIARNGEVSFQLGEYDRTRPLVIDPKLSYLTYLGGEYNDEIYAVAVDASGSAYVCGETWSGTFPATEGAFQTAPGPGDFFAFVTKLDPAGAALVYSTYLYGEGNQAARAIAVDGAGNAYVGGDTTSYFFPTTTGAFQPATADLYNSDGFLTKLNPTGSQLVFSTFIAGTGDDIVTAVAVDSVGASYVTGVTGSTTSFPVKAGAVQTVNNGSADAFVLKLDASGTTAVYSTFLGGSQNDLGEAIAMDAAGNAYVAGATASADFPATAGAYSTVARGKNDGFLAKLSGDGAALVYSTRVGGSDDDDALALTVDAQGNAYLAGRTFSVDFPTTAGAYQTGNRGLDDAFLAKVNAAGTGLVYATLIGGSKSDLIWGVAVDAGGNAYVAGQTESANFPTSGDAIQPVLGGANDAFVAKANSDGSVLAFSTYLGGSALESGNAIAVDGAGAVYVGGSSSSSDLPVTSGAFQSTRLGMFFNGFVAKLDLAAPTETPTLSIILGNNQAGSPGATLPSPLVVELRDRNGPVVGVTVTFSGSNVTLNPANMQTDADGHASTRATLGAAAGAVIVTATAPGARGVTFTETVDAAPPAVATTSAASYGRGALAPEMIAAAWGSGFATGEFAAQSIPLPTQLGNVTLTLRDSSGVSRAVPLFYVSAGQINFQVPAEAQGGAATLTVNGAGGSVQTASITIESVFPGLFSQNGNGSGVAAGAAIRVKADGSQSTLAIARYDAAQQLWVADPIDLGDATDQTILALYGTGFRHRSSLANVSVTIGGQNAEVLYAGAQGSYVGLDQLNVRLPRTLAGRGAVSVVMVVDGKTANAVTVAAANAAAPPRLISMSPSSARAGQTITLTLGGSGLTGAQLAFDSWTGLTASNVTSTSSQVTATLAIDASAAVGTRQLSVSTDRGRSNALPFRIEAP